MILQTLSQMTSEQGLSRTRGGDPHLYDNLNLMLAASEDMVMDGKSMVITTNTPLLLQLYLIRAVIKDKKKIGGILLVTQARQ